MADRVTIIDLARELGLSKTTVSDALRGRGQVAQETRQQVLDVAHRMGYVSNRAARSLRRSQVGALGLYIPPIVRDFSFYMEFAFGAADAAAALDLDLTLVARDPDRSVGRPFQIDGAIVVDPLPDDVMVHRMTQQGVPVVTAGRALADSAAKVDAVIEAKHGESAMAVLELLWQVGRRRPAFMSSDQRFFSSWAHDVRTAYLDWCASHDVEPHVREVSVQAPPEDLQLVVKALVDEENDVDALVCGPQGFAGRTQPILDALGHTVGPTFDLVSLVGDPVTELVDPRISCVDIRPSTFGREAVTLLTDLLGGGVTGPIRRTHETYIRYADHLGSGRHH